MMMRGRWLGIFMIKKIILSVTIIILCSSFALAQTEPKNQDPDELDDLDFDIPEEDFDLSDFDSAHYSDVRYSQGLWQPYVTKCKPCENLVKEYNTGMTQLNELRSFLGLMKLDKTLDGNAPTNRPSPNATEAEMATALAKSINRREITTEIIPEINATIKNLEQMLTYLRLQIAQCEKKNCTGSDIQITESSIKGAATLKPIALPFNWQGPYPPVCFNCAKLAAQLNGLPAIARYNARQIIIYNAKKLEITSRLKSVEYGMIGVTDKKLIRQIRDGIKKLNRELRDVERHLKTLLKDREKIIKNFNDTLNEYNKCIKKCPVKKIGYVFPNKNYVAMTIGPNDQYGSSAQAAKELRDRATGAVKGAATKALGSLLGFGGGGGGSSGPKTDRDRSRGDFVTIWNDETALDVRASWRDDQLIVSTEIKDTPGNGTFHAQWIEDIDGNVYLPTRYLIYKMYRDWKLTVSWTEDHYVNGEHVFHDEGQKISTGSDLLSTWSIFEGAEGIENSIWGMLGFDTAAKGVSHLGAVYDLTPDAFSETVQMQLVNHISLPDNDPVTTIPVVGELFKHVDESRKKPETLIFIQPHLLDLEDLE